jgi:hypothetical protein
LQGVGVLKLIDQNMAKPALVLTAKAFIEKPTTVRSESLKLIQPHPIVPAKNLG